MANSPPSRHVVKYKGAGNVQVFPNLPTMLNGSQDGSDVGTGGPALAALENTAIDPGTFVANRTIEFLDDRFTLACAVTGEEGGVYKKNQGGAGQWGQVTPHPLTGPGDSGSCSGLHVLHPAGVPTLAYLVFVSSGARFYKLFTTDGVAWTTTQIEDSTSDPASFGQSLVFRATIVWAHQQFGGTAGTGSITQYDFVTNVLTRYDISALTGGSLLGAGHALHVHDNVLFLASWAVTTRFGRLMKLQAGTFVTVYTESTDIQWTQDTNTFEHSALFTDDATGDLVLIMGQSRNSNNAPRAKVVSFADATGAATPTDITTTVMGAVEGADKYLEGGGSAARHRRWSVYVDNDTVPGTPRTFLTTWDPGFSTETWEWTGVGTEMEAVASLSGISDDFARPYVTKGGGIRGPGGAPRGELGDVSNPAEAVAAGTKWYFRVYGTGGPGVMTVYYNADEETPDSIATLTGSVVVESGSPATTPTRSGNTITNLTADDGVALYSFVHDVSADGLGVGAPHTLSTDIV